MSNKYVIRNCPAIVQSSYKNRDWAIENACELIDDRCCIKQNCLLKQIVGLCKEVENIENIETLYDAAQSGIFLQANRILKFLDIEEVEQKLIIDDGNGNIINTRDGCINHTEVLYKIRDELKDILKQPVGFVSPSIRGLIDYIGDVLGE